jgi:hypothetical protein
MLHRCRARVLALELVALLPWVATSAGCKQAEPSPGAASASAATATARASVDFSATGLTACDRYFAAVKACAPKLDERARSSLEQEVQQYRSQITQAGSEAARDAVAVGCDAAREALAEEGCE